MTEFKRGRAGVVLSLMAVAVVGFSFISPSAPAARAQDAAARNRLPEPDAAAQAKAEALVRDVYEADYARRKLADRLELSKRLMRQATETTDDPAARYVLLREARDLAASAGDVAAALEAADLLAASYDVDGARMKFQALDKVPAVGAETAAAVVRAYLDVSESALAAEEFGLAGGSASKASAAARKARDAPLARQAKDQMAAVKAARRDFDAAEAARKKLAGEPDDPAANLTLGRHLCFVKGDWEDGLPMLARSDEPAVKSLAERELAKPRGAAAMVAMGDAWWALPDKRGGISTAEARERAAYWYGRALPHLAGLKRTATERRIAEAAADSTAAKRVYYLSDDDRQGIDVGMADRNIGKDFVIELEVAAPRGDPGRDGIILSKRQVEGDQSLTVMLLRDGRVDVISDASFRRIDLAGPAQVNDGKWHRVRVEKHGALVSIHIDGKRQGEIAMLENYTSQSPWMLGRQGAWGATAIDCKVRVIRIGP